MVTASLECLKWLNKVTLYANRKFSLRIPASDPLLSKYHTFCYISGHFAALTIVYVEFFYTLKTIRPPFCYFFIVKNSSLADINTRMEPVAHAKRLTSDVNFPLRHSNSLSTGRLPNYGRLLVQTKQINNVCFKHFNYWKQHTLQILME